MKFKQVVLWGIPPVLLFMAVLVLWNNPVFKGYFSMGYWKAVGKFGESLRIAHARYVDANKSSYEKLTDSALEGMASSLDRYSGYFPPSEHKEFKDETKLRYYGIGIVIRKIEKGILVTRVFPGGSAFEEGVLPGEFIARVENQTVDGWSVREVSRRIKGEEGTDVRIGIKGTEGEEREVEVTRRRIELSSVEDAVADENGTGYVRIQQFTERTGKELSKSLEELKKKGLKRLIIDLRDNSGGLLDAAIDVAEQFLEEGELVVSVRERDGSEERTFFSKPETSPIRCPLVILINEGSASASEIVAGALSVSGRAKLVGEKSFGKGSVQVVFSLGDDSGLKLTTAMYFLPDGSTIHENGLQPDVLVECSEEDEAKLRDQRHQDAFKNPRAFEELFGFAPVRDRQYLSAVACLMNDVSKPSETDSKSSPAEP